MLLATDTVADVPQLAEKLADYYSGEVHTTRAFTPTLAAARQLLSDFNPSGYAKTRDHVDGGVSKLNPYVTWGVFTLRELQDAVRGKGSPTDYKKFVSELGWKAYFREVFMAMGGAVYDTLEPYKYPTRKQETLPEALATGTTGLDCIDSIVRELIDTGYLHNHKRMWFAAHLVHYENIEWWHGEELFYHYLLDGEPGPNALSWQWVASTFARKPYFFNAQNMRKYGHPCQDAPFNKSYEALDQQYFRGHGDGGYARRPSEQPQAEGIWAIPELVRPAASKPLVVLHAERLSDRAVVLAALPNAPVLVMLDGERLQSEAPSFMRLHWAVSLAADLVEVLRSSGRDADLILMEDTAELLSYAEAKGCSSLAAPDSWHPETWHTLNDLDETVAVSVVPDAPFAQVRASLRSFSSYWKKAEKEVMHR